MANYGNLQATLPTRRGESKIKITKFPLFGISFPKWTPKKLPRFALAFFSKRAVEMPATYAAGWHRLGVGRLDQVGAP